MVARRIIFLPEVLTIPAITAALAADGATAPDVDGRLAEFLDERSDDYAELRLQLSQIKQPYDFHQCRADDGDNAVWHHGRNGVERFSNYGLAADGWSPMMSLRAEQD